VSDATRLFSPRVEDYIRYRPSYPPAIIDLLERECGLTREWAVADVGSGPGNLSRLFLEHGNRVLGVEPNREMREAGERLLPDHPGFVSVDGAAEATGLPDGSVDLVAAGQAFHWFDQGRARLEFRRILRPPRWVALVWNERRVGGAPFQEAYERLLVRYGTDYARARHRDAADAAALDGFFGPGGYGRASFENVQMFDFEGLRGRLLSSSYAPLPGQPGHAEMLAELRKIFEEYEEDGRIAFEYDTTVYYGRV
jgi:SAM-dependent methyltransferase